MIDTNLLLDIGNIVMLIGTLLLIRAVIKNRKILKGYDIIGSMFTFGGMVTFDIFYVIISNWFSLGIAMVTTSYWGLATIYTIRNKFKSRAMKQAIINKSGMIREKLNMKVYKQRHEHYGDD